MNRQVRLVILAHASAAVGMGLPWPVLLLAVEQASGSELLLGLAGAARLAPYVALSWLSGRLADRRERAHIVRLSLWARLGCLLVCGAGLAANQPLIAVIAATGAIIAGTPAYPALAAGMPRLAGRASGSATSLLVTVEVASFVVGPAVGGLFVGRMPPAWVAVVGSVFVMAGLLAFGRTAMPAPELPVAHDAPSGMWTLLRRNRSARHALAVVAVVNALLSVVGLAMLQLAHGVWGSGDEGFGLGTALLGFGALGAPAVSRLRPMMSGRGCLLALGGTAAVFGVVPGGWPALVALALLGAVAVCCESVATAVLQTAVRDSQRASVLGLADTVMVGAAMVATLITPWAGERLGPVTLILLVGAGAGAIALAWTSEGLPVGGESSSATRAEQPGEGVTFRAGHREPVVGLDGHERPRIVTLPGRDGHPGLRPGAVLGEVHVSAHGPQLW